MLAKGLEHRQHKGHTARFLPDKAAGARRAANLVHLPEERSRSPSLHRRAATPSPAPAPQTPPVPAGPPIAETPRRGTARLRPAVPGRGPGVSHTRAAAPDHSGCRPPTNCRRVFSRPYPRQPGVTNAPLALGTIAPGTRQITTSPTRALPSRNASPEDGLPLPPRSRHGA